MRITVLDNDLDQAATICGALAALGHSCSMHTTGKATLDELRHEASDLLISTWQVPDISATDLVTLAREATDSRILILATVARSAEGDAVSILRSGVDDYIVAPIRRNELTLRVSALLAVAHPEAYAEPLRFGRYTFDANTARAWHGDKEIILTRKEFAVALLLFRNLGRPLSRAYIQESVWPREEGVPSRTIDTHVSRVRTKLSLIPENGYRLVPVYSFGYRLEELA
ncbi:MAG TPA: response regulator transcription factor [Noviherbaspirillum sp.]